MSAAHQLSYCELALKIISKWERPNCYPRATIRQDAHLRQGGTGELRGKQGEGRGAGAKTEGIEYSTSNTQGMGGEKIRNDKIDEKAAISIIPVLLVTLALSITQGRHGRSSIMA